ncbi:MAG TPA: hypothetical protein VFW84_00715 [Aquabacterium sp.]|uniref:hypothetical protein n=1 Tax=Aquabacterium sp. TaxID=1872578 RepID=UPI002E357677|nr:hypothetical protein [Aquabacterium sp.]HEX5371232.1 hypothetical protein [Aquabacterium sp.]
MSLHDRGPATLNRYRGAFQSAVGGAFPGTRAVFRGQDLHRDLLGQTSWIDLYCYGVTGRRLPASHLAMLEHLCVSTSYPDARIWNNRVAALAGSTRSTINLALSAAEAVSEARIYGRRNEFRAVAFYLRTHRAMRAGASLEECVTQHLQTQGRLAGYGRPLASGDERLAPAMARARELGLDEGPHVLLAYEVERHLQAKGLPLQMNFGALVAAFGADFGLSPREFTTLFYLSFLAGMPPCYMEALSKPPGAIFPTRCEDVVYEGAPPRSWRDRNTSGR